MEYTVEVVQREVPTEQPREMRERTAVFMLIIQGTFVQEAIIWYRCSSLWRVLSGSLALALLVPSRFSVYTALLLQAGCGL